MEVFESNSAQKTQKIGADLAKKFKNGAILALVGDLGAGKTTFTQGFAEGLGIKDKVISPTFVLIRQHKFGHDQTLFHVDLYRLEGDIDIKSLGLEDMFKHKQDIVLIEWAEKVKDKLPKETIWLNFEKLDSDSRKISVKMW